MATDINSEGNNIQQPQPTPAPPPRIDTHTEAMQTRDANLDKLIKK